MAAVSGAVNDDEDTSEMWFDWADACTWTAPPADPPPADRGD